MYIPSSGNVELTDILTGLSEMQSKEKIGKLLFIQCTFQYLLFFFNPKPTLLGQQRTNVESSSALITALLRVFTKKEHGLKHTWRVLPSQSLQSSVSST